MADPTALSPSPAEAPGLWDSIGLGNLTFPAEPGEGCVVVKVKTGREVDQQKANGKNGAKTKVKGRKVAKVSITFKFTWRIWAESNALRISIDPNVDERNEPLEASYPELADRRVNRLLFTDVGELGITGDMYSFTAEADGWEEPAAAKSGGTSTPKEAVKWEDSAPGGHTTFTTSGGSTIDLGGGPVTVTTSNGSTFGFNGPNAPNANP